MCNCRNKKIKKTTTKIPKLNAFKRTVKNVNIPGIGNVKTTNKVFTKQSNTTPVSQKTVKRKAFTINNG